MADGNNTALFTGLLVLTVVSLSTLAFIGRSRLTRRYLSSDEDDLKGSGVPDVGAAPADGATGQVAPRATPRLAGETGGNDQREEQERGEEEKEEEEEELPELLKASPPCWQDPLVLGFNKLKPRTTLGSFSSIQQARCVKC